MDKRFIEKSDTTVLIKLIQRDDLSSEVMRLIALELNFRLFLMFEIVETEVANG